MLWQRVCVIASLACLVQPGIGQRITTVHPTDLGRTQDFVLPSTAVSSDLQLRFVTDQNGRLHRAEVDVLVQSDAAVLLLSPDEVMLPGMTPPILRSLMRLPMQRISPMTFGVDLDGFLIPVSTPIYAQATAMSRSGQILASDIIELGVMEQVDAGEVPISSMYTGLPIETFAGMIALTRLPPMPGSYSFEVSITVRSNDWDLSHHVTTLDEQGARVFLIMKIPGPGEGQLDVVETHSVWAELGEQLPAQADVYIAVTESWNPLTSGLDFKLAQLN